MSKYAKKNPDPIYFGTGKRHVVIGNEFGATMIAFRCELEEAIDEFDERFGDRVEPDDSALPDYLDELTAEQRVASGDAGTIAAARIFAAIDSGEARMNDGGTVVWTNPHEWMREFDDPREAMRCFLGIDK